MDKGILRFFLVFVFCGATFGVDSEVSLSSGDTRSDSSETPANDFLAEHFSNLNDAFDLSYKAVTFDPIGAGLFYRAEVQDIAQLPTHPSAGTNLGLGDEDFAFVKLAGSARVSIYGHRFSGFYVGSNGYITFTEGDRDFTERLSDHFDTLRVSGLFRDLSPPAGGRVTWRQFTNRVVVSWENVPEYDENNSNTFQIALFFNGTIQIAWEQIDSPFGIVGLSDGLGLSPDFQETDFSELSSGGPPPVSASPVEHFTGGADEFDLANTSLTFTPLAGGSSYSVELEQISQLPTNPSGGTNLGLGDDDFAFVKLAGPAAVSIYGSSFSGFYVGSNGYVTFTEGDQDYAESLADHFDTLRVSSLFRDLNPTAGGSITWKQRNDRIVVTWENVPQYGTSNSNTFQIALYYDGRIQLAWTHIDARQGIVGLSDGAGVPADFEETDFSELSGGGPPPVSDFPVEQFTGGADNFDLENTSITFSPTAAGTAYAAEIKAISQLPTNPSGGTNLGLGDDNFAFVKLVSPAMVRIYGNSFAGFFVGSNGYITFVEGDQGFTDTLAAHFELLRVSGLFRDLNPSAGGKVTSKQRADRVAVTWENVPQYGTNNSNTFQIEMFFDGRIRLSWLAVATDSGIVGFSDGAGIPPDFVETDLSELSGTPPPPPPPPPVDDFLTEQFASNADPFDLEFTSVLFTPTADGSSYTGSLQNITSLPTNPSGGTNLGLGDDIWVRVGFSNQARVRIFGQSYASVFVGSNGYITFTQGDTDFSESIAEHFETLRLSGLYTDLTAAHTGSVTGKQLFNRVAFTWQGVPEYNSSAPNTFQIELFYDGRIRLSWLEIGSRSNIVGLSDGQGVPPDFEETDFSVQYAQP